MAPTKRNLLSSIDGLPDDTKAYLWKLRPLVEEGGRYDIALAYVFMKLEEGNHRAIKCGAIRRFKCQSQKVDEALERQHFTRPYFAKVFKTVVGKSIPADTAQSLKKAEKVRDKQLHGKKVSDGELREAISDALVYIATLGEFVKSETGKNPFGDLRGLVGRSELLDKQTSHFVLKGFGLYTQEQS